MNRRMMGAAYLGILATVLAACAPQGRGVGPVSDPGAAGVSTAPKVLRISVQREPDHFLRPGTQGQMLAFHLTDEELTVFNDRGELVPRLAREVPTLENGGWRLLPDGTMEVVWKLRTNVQWHDGQRMTSDDLVFGWEYLSHPNSILPKLRWTPAVERVSAPDAETFVVNFKRIEAMANIGHGGGNPLLRPIPRHILGATFARGDVDAFNSSLHWRDAYIGVGPYRLVRWDPGTRMEFSRFDGYFLGRPRLDTVLVSFFPDNNALLANILAGEADLNTGAGFGAHQAIELQRRWEGTGNQVLVGPNGHLEYLAAQFRLEVDVKPAALRDRAVRQALLRGLDREALAEAVSLGLSPVADSWAPPDDPRRQIASFRDSIILYPYDPGRAQRELEALGWTRGADSIYVNQAGERFELEIRNTPSAEAELSLNVLGDSYKRIGVSIIQTIVTPQRARDREYRSLYTGMELTSNGYDTVENYRFHTAQRGTPADQYAGYNKGGYSNPQMDVLLDRLAMTIPLDQRAALTAETLRIALTDLPFLPLYWDIDVVVALARVRNIPRPSSYGGDTWNLWEWDLATG